jgi:hypothetical protein
MLILLYAGALAAASSGPLHDLVHEKQDSGAHECLATLLGQGQLECCSTGAGSLPEPGFVVTGVQRPELVIVSSSALRFPSNRGPPA